MCHQLNRGKFYKGRSFGLCTILMTYPWKGSLSRRHFIPILWVTKETEKQRWGPLGSLTPRGAQDSREQLPSLCAWGCSYFLQKVNFSSSPRRGVHTASLSPEITFLTSKIERSPSFLVSLLSDISPASFPSVLRHENHCHALWKPLGI